MHAWAPGHACPCPLIHCSDVVDILLASVSHASHPRVPCDHSLLGPVQGIRALPPLEGFMSRWEGLQGTVPDWRRIPFWRIGGYAPAWEAFTEKEMELPTSQNIERTVRRDECAPFPLLLQPMH